MPEKVGKTRESAARAKAARKAMPRKGQGGAMKTRVKSGHMVPRETLSLGIKDMPIAGIGASAGGLDALSRFVAAVPPNSGIGYVLIQHLDPTQIRLTAELLGRHTSMPVV